MDDASNAITNFNVTVNANTIGVNTTTGPFTALSGISAVNVGSVSRLGNNMNTGNQSANVSGNTGNAGSGSSHNHPWSGSVNVGVQYVDFIICTKT